METKTTLENMSTIEMEILKETKVPIMKKGVIRHLTESERTLTSKKRIKRDLLQSLPCRLVSTTEGCPRTPCPYLHGT